MAFTNDRLNAIFDRTSGRCHICHERVVFKNYGALGARGAWEVEHSNPRARGGTNRLTNLYPACISCNRSKGAMSTRYARAAHGKYRAPVSVFRCSMLRRENALLAAVTSAVIAKAVHPSATTSWLAATALFGAMVGHEYKPEE